MNLTIDIGNTRVKLGLFDQGKLVRKLVQDEWNEQEILDLATNQKVKNIILSTVGHALEDQWISKIAQQFRLIILNENTALPFVNAYETPQTLGKDRLAAVAGALVLFPGKHCLIIDAGTCITYELLDANGVYLGGNIAPGIELRLKAMHAFTANLPKIEQGTIDQNIGKSTETAMRNGGQLGAVMEAEGFIDLYRQKFGQINVILTGGDADFFAKKMKSKIFVNHDLTLLGLNKILNYNVERSE